MDASLAVAVESPASLSPEAVDDAQAFQADLLNLIAGGAAVVNCL